MCSDSMAPFLISARTALFMIAREVGLWVETSDGPACELHVVPLFETIEDLEIAPAVVQKYLVTLSHGGV